jgi:tRNA A-37 threonylcarbamoyl transferase component Bud32
MEPKRFGKYRVLRRIASGGMSEVYLCRLTGEEGFRKRVALKVVHPRHAGDQRFRDLFIREARLAASLSHPNLIQVFDFGKEGDAFFLAMEYVEGGDLAQAAAQARQAGVAIPPGVWRHWIEGIWAGLGNLHDKKIVHGDVSPGNVLLGRTGAVKLADFGVSRAAAESDEARDFQAGKYAYLSPERARGEAATAASDLFAAAMISAELLLGRRLFEGGSAEAAMERLRRFDGAGLELPGVGERVAEVIRTGLAADPAKRYRSAGDFLTALSARAPARASAAELADFWDALFPHDEEEETAPLAAMGPDPAPSMVREPRPRYGVGRKTLRAGAAAVFVALAAGGVLLFPGVEKGDRQVVPAIVASPETDRSHARAGHPPKSGEEPGTAIGADTPRSQTGPPPRALVPSPAGPLPATPHPLAAPEPPARHFVRIETEPEGATILLENGKAAGTTPARLDTASLGDRGITLAREGYERKIVPAGALGQVATFRTELDPILGTVEAIQAIPWGQVYFGGRLLGETPLTKVKLPVGEHRLRFVNGPLGVEKTVTVVVHAGSNPKVIVRLAENGRR